MYLQGYYTMFNKYVHCVMLYHEKYIYLLKQVT